MAELMQVNSLFTDANIVSYYRMQGNSNDAKGSNNGTDTNITYAIVSGRYGQGARLATLTSGIDLGNPVNLQFERTNSFSVVFWFYITAIGVTRFFFSKELASGTFAGYALSQQSNQLEIDLINNVATPNKISVVTTAAFTTINTWTHCGFTYDGSSTAAGVKIYINGFPQALTINNDSLGALSILASTTFVIGNRSAGFNFTGRMDDFAIFSRVVTAAEMFTLASDYYPVSRLRPAIFTPG